MMMMIKMLMMMFTRIIEAEIRGSVEINSVKGKYPLAQWPSSCITRTPVSRQPTHLSGTDASSGSSCLSRRYIYI